MHFTVCKLYLKKWKKKGKEVLSDMGLITHEIQKAESRKIEAFELWC